MPQIIDGGGPGGGAEPLQINADTCAQILDIVGTQLKDITKVTWSTTKTFPYLNLGVKEIVNLKPEAYAVTFGNVQLAAGPRQNLPPGALFLVDVEGVVNLSNNLTSSVQLITKAQMDRLFPGWYAFAGDDTIQYVMRDDRNPEVFYVFPPPPPTTTQAASLICSCYPAEVTSLVQNDNVTPTDFPLDNSYVPAIVDYIIYRCLVEETEIPNAQAKGTAFYQMFLQKLGAGKAAKAKSDAEGM